jgi:hypothetical protein
LFCSLPHGGIESLVDGGLEKLMREIVELCPEARPLAEQIRCVGDLATARYQIVKLRQWNVGRLICIGDAAHATTPHLGQGVNLALLDAVALSAAVRGNKNVLEALADVSQERRRLTMCRGGCRIFWGRCFRMRVAVGVARDTVLPCCLQFPLWADDVETMAGLRTGMWSRLS